MAIGVAGETLPPGLRVGPIARLRPMAIRSEDPARLHGLGLPTLAPAEHVVQLRLAVHDRHRDVERDGPSWRLPRSVDRTSASALAHPTAALPAGLPRGGGAGRLRRARGLLGGAPGRLRGLRKSQRLGDRQWVLRELLGFAFGVPVEPCDSETDFIPGRPLVAGQPCPRRLLADLDLSALRGWVERMGGHRGTHCDAATSR